MFFAPHLYQYQLATHLPLTQLDVAAHMQSFEQYPPLGTNARPDGV